MRASRVGIASTTEEALLRSVAAEVPLDPDFGLVVELFHNAGAEVTLVSDGFGFYVWEVGQRCWHSGHDSRGRLAYRNTDVPISRRRMSLCRMWYVQAGANP